MMKHHQCAEWSVFLAIFFFLLLPPPPSSTLFPYTTLFRSREPSRGAPVERRVRLRTGCARDPAWHDPRDGPDRSEEHTSELQSRGHLVCRLLLEKKKTQAYTTPQSYHADPNVTHI